MLLSQFRISGLLLFRDAVPPVLSQWIIVSYYIKQRLPFEPYLLASVLPFVRNHTKQRQNYSCDFKSCIASESHDYLRWSNLPSRRGTLVNLPNSWQAVMFCYVSFSTFSCPSCISCTLAFLTRCLVIFLKAQFFPILFSRHRGLSSSFVFPCNYAYFPLCVSSLGSFLPCWPPMISLPQFLSGGKILYIFVVVAELRHPPALALN